MSRIECMGQWTPASVTTRWIPSTHSPPPEVESLIDAAWTKLSARPGIHLFDGPLCRLEGFDAGASRFDLRFSRTTYKVFVGTNMAHPELADRYGQGMLANSIGVSVLVESADGFLLLGRRNHRVAWYPNRIHPIAGSLEPGEGDGNGPDVFGSVLRELSEEVSLSGEDLSLLRCLGLVQDTALLQPELIFHARCRKRMEQIEAGFGDEEHTACIKIAATPEDVAAMSLNSELTPVAKATLLLFGRTEFGDAWLAEQLGVDSLQMPLTVPK